MKTNAMTKNISVLRKIAFTALFAALCCVGTLAISIPLPTGYANVGDVFVLLAGWLLGPVYGVIAAGLGSGLADVFAGFAIYAPATLVIKACVALIGFFIRVLLRKAIKKMPDVVAIIIAAILAEAFMVLGYFTYETILYGVETASLALFGNGMQGLLCCACGVAVACALKPIKFIHRAFPLFDGGAFINKAKPTAEE